jgi:branched-subunit amino acid aminotransferase/4-amino-4-deoxychorismate lyase
MAVEKVSANAGLAYEELPLMPDFILTAEECFVSSATREVMPVVAIRLENGEWKKFPGAAGRATQALQKAYANFLQEYRRENSASSLWATKQST